MEHTKEFLEIVVDARSCVREISVEETLEKVKDGARLIDVREDNEWNAGHAAGAALSNAILSGNFPIKTPN